MRRVLRGPWLWLILAAVVVLTLSGCRAQVGTSVEVTGKSSASVRVSAIFTGEAAAAMSESTQARSELNELFKARVGKNPKIEAGKDKFTATVDVDYDQVEQVADLTGVTYLTLTEEGKTATVGVAPATKIAETITAVNATEPDADALSSTMTQNTQLVVKVSYPGGVDDAKVRDASGAEVSGADIDVDGDTATYTRTLDSQVAGEFVVAGSTGIAWWWWAGGGALLVAAFWLRRTRPV